MSFLKDLFGGVEDAIKNIGSGFEDTVRGIGGGVDDLFRGDFSGFDDRLNDAFSGLDDMVNNIPGGWMSVASLGGFMPNFGDMMGLEDMFTKRLVNSAAQGGMSAAAGGGNIAQGIGLGALSGGISGMNPAGSMGVTNPMAGKAINSAISGGVTSAAQGGDFLRGAAQGGAMSGLSSGISSGINNLGSMFNAQPQQTQGPALVTENMSLAPYQPSAARVAIDDLMQQSRPEYMQQSIMEPESFLSIAGQDGTAREQTQSMGSLPSPNFMSADTSNLSSSGTGAFSSWLESDIGKKFNQLVQSINPEKAGNIAAKGLLGLYGYNRANKAYKNQINNLNSLFAPNSPYAQQMKQSLERKDAAAGRRSQYGPREVELQARLAEMASRQSPQLAQLYQGQNQNRDRLINSAFKLFNDAGGMRSIADLFKRDNSPYMGPFNYSDGFQPDPYSGV